MSTDRTRPTVYRRRHSWSGTAFALLDFVYSVWLSRSIFVALVALGIVLSGCVSTRVAEVGMLSNGERLITLVVSEDRQLVHRQCQDVPALGPVLGCQASRTLELPNGAVVRTVKLVRFTDALPSRMAFEIDAHELCHAIAAVQGIEDPCHAENRGIVESSALLRLQRLP